jgi:hypothetical protein
MSNDRNPHRLYFELKLVDGYGEIHGIVRREIDKDAAFKGQRIAEEASLGIFPRRGGESAMSALANVLQVREFRRDLLVAAAKVAAQQLADFLQDREGWHGLDRQDAVEKIVKGSR